VGGQVFFFFSNSWEDKLLRWYVCPTGCMETVRWCQDLKDVRFLFRFLKTSVCLGEKKIGDNIFTLFRSIKYKVIIKLITQVNEKSQDVIKSN
jgi:hypothetical protein